MMMGKGDKKKRGRKLLLMPMAIRLLRLRLLKVELLRLPVLQRYSLSSHLL